MHIPDGVLSGEVTTAGAIGAGVGVALSLRQLQDRDMPKVALMAATFFAVSLLHIPLPILGATSMHLVLCGMTGILLGVHAFPAMTIALALQAFLYHHGGVGSLGNNIVNMALPAAIFGLLARRAIGSGVGDWSALVGGLVGALAASAACALELSCYVLSNSGYWVFVPPAILANLPLIGVEAVVTGLAVSLIARSRSDLLGIHPRLHGRPTP